MEELLGSGPLRPAIPGIDANRDAFLQAFLAAKSAAAREAGVTLTLGKNTWVPGRLALPMDVTTAHVHLDLVVRRAGLLRVHSGAERDPLRRRGTAANNAFYNLVGDIMDNKFKMFIVLNSALFAALGNMAAANTTASRLVYSMARDGHLPKLFARVSGKHKVPMNAMVMISALALAIGIFGVSQASLLTTLVTFGALLSYILMHVSVITHFVKRGGSRRWFTHLVSPLLGAAILMVALWDADANAKIVGIIWLAIGLGVATYLRMSGRDLRTSEV